MNEAGASIRRGIHRSEAVRLSSTFRTLARWSGNWRRATLWSIIVPAPASASAPISSTLRKRLNKSLKRSKTLLRRRPTKNTWRRAELDHESVPRAVASVFGRRLRSLPLAVLTRRLKGATMPMFVHLTREKDIKAILRNGISRLRKRSGRPHGIFAMPVTRNFYVSHQWLRELKRRGPGTIAGVYFRIPDEENVWVGHYNQSHRQMTAAEAAALMSGSESQEGYEVIIPRR